ncbi:MAG: hypothetical protein IPK39_21685 [Sulfuritalea sp.]|nr:hypothetical protein [Sulfuritalea sp.]
MVGYVLRPSPDKSYVGVAIAALVIQALRVGGVGRFRAKGRGHWPALPVVSPW